MTVALVSMPWASVVDPSLALSILQSSLTSQGRSAKVLNFNMLLLKYIRFDTYCLLADSCGLNDFIFSENLSGEIDELQLSTLVRICEVSYKTLPGWSQKFTSVGMAVDLILEIRNQIIPKYLGECVDALIKNDPIAVGMTCLFDQTIASVSLCQAIKSRSNIPTALGGYSVWGVTAENLVKAFPCVDVVFSGEGENSINAWIECIENDAGISKVPGAVFVDEVNELRSVAPIKIDLQESPEPIFEDFFHDLKTLEELHSIRINNQYLPVESSRGCWWGQKHHCTFCGIDKEALKYRSKPPLMVAQHLSNLRKKYGEKRYTFVDYILPRGYFETLLPQLAKEDPPYYLTCETKSNLTSKNMESLQAAGYREVQPGIESFCSNTLRKMNKGVSAAQNVLTLKLGKLNGIKIHYNILYGFPDDVAQDYDEMIGKLPSLCHLDCPHTCLSVLVTRNAPLYDQHQKFGYRRPKPSYRYNVIFSESYLSETGFELQDFSYIFDRPFQTSEDLFIAYKILDTQVTYWREKEKASSASLIYREEGGVLLFSDTRWSENEILVELSSEESTVYLACDLAVKSLSMILHESELEEEVVRNAIVRLKETRLIFADHERYVGLGIADKPTSQLN